MSHVNYKGTQNLTSSSTRFWTALSNYKAATCSGGACNETLVIKVAHDRNMNSYVSSQVFKPMPGDGTSSNQHYYHLHEYVNCHKAS